MKGILILSAFLLATLAATVLFIVCICNAHAFNYLPLALLAMTAVGIGLPRVFEYSAKPHNEER